NIGNTTGGTVTLSGAINDTGTGILLDNNDGATISFSGGLTLNTGAHTAFTATNGGTVNVTGTNTIGAAAALSTTAVNIADTTIGASGVTFKSIAVNGAAKGVSLNNTSGTFSVTGTGTTDGSGGTIQSISGRGIEVIGPASAPQPTISIKNMHLTNTA